MPAFTNRTGTPQWDAHGRLVPPGRVIAIEEAAPEAAAPDSELGARVETPANPEDSAQAKGKAPGSDGRAGKPGSK